jgi:RNAse (barnase) inhibitor barstar
MGIRENSPEWKKHRDANIDLWIIGKGFISLYYNQDIIDYDIDLLEAKKYKIIEFDGDFITDKMELHFALEAKLQFPGYYGHNFHALNDCLGDYEVDVNGVVLVFRGLDNLDIETIHVLLDVFAHSARRKFAAGRKMLILVQVNNPRFNIKEPIGAVNFYLWNDKEWFEGNRR